MPLYGYRQLFGQGFYRTFFCFGGAFFFFLVSNLFKFLKIYLIKVPCCCFPFFISEGIDRNLILIAGCSSFCLCK